MKCRKPNGVLITLPSNCAGLSKCGGWKFFLANCPKTNMMCSGLSGAWVPAITVCNQQLYS